LLEVDELLEVAEHLFDLARLGGPRLVQFGERFERLLFEARNAVDEPSAFSSLDRCPSRYE
jgi:hypothetical protein